MKQIAVIKKTVEDIIKGVKVIPVTKWMPNSNYIHNPEQFLKDEVIRLRALGCKRVHIEVNTNKKRLVRGFSIDEFDQWNEIKPIISQPSNNNNAIKNRLTKKQYKFLLWLDSLV